MPFLTIGGAQISFVYDNPRNEGYLGESDIYFFPQDWQNRQGEFMRMGSELICTCHYASGKVDEVVTVDTQIHGKLQLKPVSVMLGDLIADGETINSLELGKRFWLAVNQQ